MSITPDAFLTEADNIVLENLLQDIAATHNANGSADTHVSEKLDGDEKTVQVLQAFNDPKSQKFTPTIFTGYDDEHLNPTIRKYIVEPYASLARHVVRNPTDVVFLTHLILYHVTLLSSVYILYNHFTWYHGIFHYLMQSFYAGPWTLLLHNHIHNNGILKKKFFLIDYTFPFVIGPLMGHTWNSYYFHHVKHHHVEGNGPDDLSSTVRYQRDEWFDFLCYLGRFMAFVWIELPIYFFRKGKYGLSAKAFVSETSSMLAIALITWYNWRPALMSLCIPLFQMRVGMMIGNWGQHALVDEVEPDSDFRSSITLIDVPSNRFCFNDGYHTSHHLNPLRHWRDHPAAFVKAKERYQKEGALVFTNIDYLFITFRLLQKNYDVLAKCLVPIGDQVHMTHQEKMDMLRRKTRKFTEEDIHIKFEKHAAVLTK